MYTNVTCDPPFYTMSHESEIDESFTSLAITIDPFALAGWTSSRSRTFDCRVGHGRLSIDQVTLAFALVFVARPHVNPLALVAPIRGLVDDFQLR